MQLSVIKVIMICLFLGSAGVSTAQSFSFDEPAASNVNWKDRFFTGGNLGAQFGDYTYVQVAPLLGFKVTEDYQIGTRVTYQYLSIRSLNFSTNIYGGSLFMRYFFFNNFFAHSEFELLNGPWDPTGERYNMPSLFAGGGYMFPLGDRAGINLMALYNFLDNPDSPYRNPVLSMGFNIGF